MIPPIHANQMQYCAKPLGRPMHAEFQSPLWCSGPIKDKHTCSDFQNLSRVKKVKAIKYFTVISLLCITIVGQLVTGRGPPVDDSEACEWECSDKFAVTGDYDNFIKCFRGDCGWPLCDIPCLNTCIATSMKLNGVTT
jgi:hypothetical protein